MMWLGERIQEIGWYFLVACVCVAALRRWLIEFVSAPVWFILMAGIVGFMGLMALGAGIVVLAGGQFS